MVRPASCRQGGSAFLSELTAHGEPELRLSEKPDALILAAGEGTRLGALTAQCPKPLLPIGGRPALFWTLDWLRTAGVHCVAVNVHYRPEAFYETLRTRYRDVTISYRYEPSLLGSAGTLRTYLSTFPGRSVLLVYGDVLTTLCITRLIAFHQSRPIHPAATLAVHAVSQPESGGVICMAGDRITAFEEKPVHPMTSSIFAGVAVVDTGILPFLPTQVPCDLGRDVFPQLCSSDFPLYAHPLAADEYLIDFGTPASYRQACRDWPKRMTHDPVSDTIAR